MSTRLSYTTSLARTLSSSSIVWFCCLDVSKHHHKSLSPRGCVSCVWGRLPVLGLKESTFPLERKWQSGPCHALNKASTLTRPLRLYMLFTLSIVSSFLLFHLSLWLISLIFHVFHLSLSILNKRTQKSLKYLRSISSHVFVKNMTLSKIKNPKKTRVLPEKGFGL